MIKEARVYRWNRIEGRNHATSVPATVRPCAKVLTHCQPVGCAHRLLLCSPPADRASALASLQLGNHDALYQEFSSHTTTKDHLRINQAQFRGALANEHQAVAQARRDLDTPQYQDIDNRWVQPEPLVRFGRARWLYVHC